MLAPLGAFGSAAPVSQSGVARRVGPLCRISTDSKASDGPRPTRRPHRKNHLFHFLPTLGPQMADFWPTFCRSKNSLKIGLLKDPPKSSRSRHLSPPWPPKIDFGCLRQWFRPRASLGWIPCDGVLCFCFSAEGLRRLEVNVVDCWGGGGLKSVLCKIVSVKV